MSGHHKSRSPESNTTDPAFLARWEAHRHAIRPPECNGRRPCWVTRPYEAISTNTRKPHCTGCGGLIAPVNHGQRLTGFWPEPVAAILSALERGEA